MRTRGEARTGLLRPVAQLQESWTCRSHLTMPAGLCAMPRPRATDGDDGVSCDGSGSGGNERIATCVTVLARAAGVGCPALAQHPDPASQSAGDLWLTVGESCGKGCSVVDDRQSVQLTPRRLRSREIFNRPFAHSSPKRGRAERYTYFALGGVEKTAVKASSKACGMRVRRAECG